MFPNNLLKGTHMRLMSAAQCLCWAESTEYLTMNSCFQSFTSFFSCTYQIYGLKGHYFLNEHILHKGEGAGVVTKASLLSTECSLSFFWEEPSSLRWTNFCLGTDTAAGNLRSQAMGLWHLHFLSFGDFPSQWDEQIRAGARLLPVPPALHLMLCPAQGCCLQGLIQHLSKTLN